MTANVLTVASVVMVVGLAGHASAQTTASSVAPGDLPRVAVLFTAGAQRLMRFEDRTFGTTATVGGGALVRLTPRLALEVDAHHQRGPSPTPVSCNLIGVTCTGSGHDGVRSATLATTSLVIEAGRARVRPYLSAGIDVFGSRMVNSLTTVGGDEAHITEFETTDTGLGLALGGGVRIPLSARVSVRPDLRLYGGSIRGRHNLNALRISVGVLAGW